MSLWYKSWHSFVLTKLSKKEGDVLHCTSTAEITPSDWCLCEIWLHIIERHRASLPSLQMLFFFLFSYLMVSREAWFTHKLKRKCFSVWTVFVEKLKIPLQLCCVTLQEQKYCLPPARDGAFAASWLCRVSCSDRCKRDVKRKVGVGFSSGRPGTRWGWSASVTVLWILQPTSKASPEAGFWRSGGSEDVLRAADPPWADRLNDEER